MTFHEIQKKEKLTHPTLQLNTLVSGGNFWSNWKFLHIYISCFVSSSFFEREKVKNYFRFLFETARGLCRRCSEQTFRLFLNLHSVIVTLSFQTSDILYTLLWHTVSLSMEYFCWSFCSLLHPGGTVSSRGNDDNTKKPSSIWIITMWIHKLPCEKELIFQTCDFSDHPPSRTVFI